MNGDSEFFGETYTLNDKQYVSRLITPEESERINKNREGGCRRCELSHTVGSENYGMTITGDVLKTTIDDKHLSVQISFCLFCGAAL